MLSLSNLPTELLARILCSLPCDEHARCVVLNRRFALLIGSGVTWTRVAFACNRTLDVATRRSLLQRAGDALREVDASEAHAADTHVLSATLAFLSAAQRGALTALRCTRHRASMRSATPLPDVAAALAQCPGLQALDVDVSCDSAAQLAALMREHPQLRVHRAYYLHRELSQTPTAADFQTLLRGCAEVHTYGMLDGAWLVALEAALEVERGAGGACARLVLSLPSAEASRLARQPCVTGLALPEGWSDAQFDELCTVLEMPECSVRALLLKESILSGINQVRLALALERGARLEHLELSFEFNAYEEHVGGDGILDVSSGFPRLCTALVNSQLQTLKLVGVGYTNFPAVLLLLRASRTLRHLGLSDFFGHIAELATVLSSPCSRLVTLQISDATLGRTGAAELAEMLRRNTSLRELHAGGFDVHEAEREVCWNDRDVATVLDALRVNTTLRQLTVPAFAEGQDEQPVWRLCELQIAALRTECPRAADVRVSHWVE